VLCVCVCWEPEGMRPRRCGVIRYYLENHVIPSRRAPTSFLSRFAAIVSRSTRLLPRVHMEWKANVTRNILSPSYASSRRVGAAEVLRRIVEGGEIGGGGRERCSIRAGENARMHFARSVLINSAATSRLPLLPTRFN
jgi:hypothetical protein